MKVTDKTKFDAEAHYWVQLSESVMYLGAHPLAAGKHTELRGDVCEALREKIADFEPLFTAATAA